MNVSDFLLERLSAWGVRRVFGYPGDGINGLMGAFNRNDRGLRADGFSCRTQIEHGTGRRALHLAEVIQLALDAGPEGPVRSERPEAAAMARRERAVRRSMWRAELGSALAIGAPCPARGGGLALTVAAAGEIRRR